MTEKRISHCQGKGSLTHNNRRFSAKNVDSLRTKDNVVYVSQPISEAYEQLFGAAVERYNAKQKRADRQIKLRRVILNTFSSVRPRRPW